MDLNESSDVAKSESYYYASLFAKCDQEENGLVKVSVLLSTLRGLQAMAVNADGEHDDSGKNSLLELKGELDPENEDPEITLEKFTDGITSFLDKSNRWEDGNQEQILQIQMSDTEHDVQEYEKQVLRKQQTDMLHAEILDLKQHLQKVTDDNLLLRSHVTAAQDENCSVLQVLDRKTLELRAQSERIKRLERDMDDKTAIIHSLEDRNVVLCNKFSKLGNEISAFHKERKKLSSENAQLKEEVRKTLNELTSRDDQLNKVKTEATLADLQWRHREKMLNERIATLNQSIDELDEKVQELEQEHFKLRQAKTEKLELSKALSCAEELAAVDGILKMPPLTSKSICSVSYNGENFENFISNFTSDDIETEMVEVGEVHQVTVLRSVIERFDVATQFDMEDNQPAHVCDGLSQCPDITESEKGFHCKSRCCENSVGYEVTESFSDRYLIAEYIPQENCNEQLVGSVWGSHKTRAIEDFLKSKFSNSIWLVFLLVTVLFVILFTPIDDGCITNPFMFSSIENYFKYCGRLSHDKVPII